ncbi:hypothetical protein GCM10023230_26890 [Flavobacterium hankyongi]|uniref:Uncharacterized protein n=1 Tax=Flavobacterium hankyongi TaxID=1176532 RepID=A0ABP9A7S9_9FLAO
MPKRKNLKRLFKKWTIAVNTTDTSIGKNKAKTGKRRVPKPNPEKRVSPAPSKDTKHMII